MMIEVVRQSTAAYEFHNDACHVKSHHLTLTYILLSISFYSCFLRKKISRSDGFARK